MAENEENPVRKAFLEQVRLRLIGPSSPDEVLHEKPNKRYLAGMLYPKGASASSVVADEEERGDDESGDDDAPELESPMDLLFQRLPASVGLTFAIGSDEERIAVHVAAAKYLRTTAEVIAEDGRGSGRSGRSPVTRSGSVWKRNAIPERGEEVVEFSVADGRQNRVVLQGFATLQLFVRRAQGVRIATVSLINERMTEEDSAVDVEDILFQVRLRCAPGSGVPAYPDAAAISADPEAEELALQYEALPTYAVGHGCSAAWVDAGGEPVASVEIDYLPSVEVPPVTTEIKGLPAAAEAVLSIVNLQDELFDPCPGMRQLIGEYRKWRDALAALEVSERFAEPKLRITSRIDCAIDRMSDGADLLASNPQALNIFRQANRAMLLSMARAEANANRGATDRFRDVDIERLDRTSFMWRPFQLAFLLLSLRGLWNPEHVDRSTVDLIWFPTGGGKTEAYLAVAAFEMIRRRVVEGDRGGGTAVIKRYTLRLLTIQQFERAGGLICALETLRQAGAIRGSAPFSLGLWVGGDSSPNEDREAVADLAKILSSVGKVEGVKTPLKHCPACATPIVPPDKGEGSEGVGLRQEAGRVKVFCPNADCPFHAGLPIDYVDERLYASPPTMLLGTVDKFAMLAWRNEARAFFGNGRNCEPPSLVIQDELHLISGPLGTLAGIYEAAIDTAISRLGRPAKYICATATIRRADDQIRRLYGREAALFPPPGLDAGNSFFSRVSSDRGRLYVGAMGQGHTPTFSNVIVSTALLASGGVVREAFGDIADTYWTVIAYHNSKRELGKTLSLARDDIPARLRALGETRPLRASGVKELSANLRDSEIPEALHQLGTALPSGSTLDFVACTNMLSVGVDVKRLGMMLVNGQPKTVAEYIQSSSRVGRDAKRPPGVVLALFSPSKPRDRSHYEFFRSFHPAYYRHVEPTSVTPFALPAQDRGLHGAFLALVRMVSNVHANGHAARVLDSEAEIRSLAEAFLVRTVAAKDGSPEETRGCLERFISFWIEQAGQWRANLRFQSGGRQHHQLIKQFRASGEGWETLQSLRHVDTPLRLLVPMQQAGSAETGRSTVQR